MADTPITHTPHTPIDQLTPIPPYPTRGEGSERFDEKMKDALNGGSAMVAQLNKDFIPRMNEVIPVLDAASENLQAIIAAPGKADQAAASATAAAASAASSSGSATTATSAKTAAEAAKNAAQGSATAAANSATAASGSAATATTAKTEAAAAKDAAVTAKTAAQGSATEAGNSATSAAASASSASTSATTATEAKNAASGSATAAAGSATAALNAKTAAETAKTDAIAAKTAAEAARDNATASKNAAAGSATTASTKATEAATSATNANASKVAAEAAKTAAATSETNAEKSAIAAKASEVEAEKILQEVGLKGGKQYVSITGSNAGTGWLRLVSLSMKYPTAYAETHNISIFITNAYGPGNIRKSAIIELNARKEPNGSVARILNFETICCDHHFNPNEIKLFSIAKESMLVVELWAKVLAYNGWAIKPLIVDSYVAEGGTTWVFHEFNGTPVDPLPTDPAIEFPLTIGHLTDSLDVLSSSVGASATAVQKAADLAKSAKVSSESWTLSAAVPANGQITLPRGYIVGAKEMMLFKGGLLVDYVDLGTPGKWSTICKLTAGAATGDVLTMVGPLETAPTIVLDFESGVYPKELTCKRASVDYVFDDEGKVKEAPVNTPAITKDPITGRKGLQLFGTRTRLNKYYKSITNWYWHPGRGVRLVNVPDASSATLQCLHGTYDKSKDSLNGNYYYFRYGINTDIGSVPNINEKKYAITLCMKSDVSNWTLRVTASNDGVVERDIYKDVVNISNEYSIYTAVCTVKAGEFFYFAQVERYNENETTSTLDIAYIQIEESEAPTPLIAGPEGQQVTVGTAYIGPIPVDIKEFTIMNDFTFNASWISDNYQTCITIKDATGTKNTFELVFQNSLKNIANIVIRDAVTSNSFYLQLPLQKVKEQKICVVVDKNKVSRASIKGIPVIKSLISKIENIDYSSVFIGHYYTPFDGIVHRFELYDTQLSLPTIISLTE